MSEDGYQDAATGVIVNPGVEQRARHACHDERQEQGERKRGQGAQVQVCSPPQKQSARLSLDLPGQSFMRVTSSRKVTSRR